MIPVHSDIIQYRGSHYDFGYMQGNALRNSPILPHRQRQKKIRKRHFLIDEQATLEVLKSFAPQIIDEIMGLADALKWDLQTALREFGGYYLEYGRSGCSIFTDNNFMIRNYDSNPRSYEGRLVLYHPKDRGYATIGPSMQITGRTDGMNEKGLTVGYNFVNRKFGLDGFVCNMIGRMVLETCENVDEAIEVLKEIPHRHSFNYVLLDPLHNTTVVEASPRTVKVRESQICTNHFEELLEENRYRMDDSNRRYDEMIKQQLQIKDSYEAFRMMNDLEKSVFSTKYDASAGTLHTSSYFPRQRKVWFALGGDRQPFIMDFQKWLGGENMLATKIKGNIKSEYPFINNPQYIDNCIV